MTAHVEEHGTVCAFSSGLCPLPTTRTLQSRSAARPITARSASISAGRSRTTGVQL